MCAHKRVLSVPTHTCVCMRGKKVDRKTDKKTDRQTDVDKLYLTERGVYSTNKTTALCKNRVRKDCLLKAREQGQTLYCVGGRDGQQTETDRQTPYCVNKYVGSYGSLCLFGKVHDSKCVYVCVNDQRAWKIDMCTRCIAETFYIRNAKANIPDAEHTASLWRLPVH